ncbi:MAG TPA: lysylphosphatidylglycerol synthase transmembrane domain-containing protein [Phototrophicaceae bacterium]|nr:lysylphosphatidylglycerol synthase transmembrane domain-containing protein [Phototrophicaceae bacterium]
MFKQLRPYLTIAITVLLLLLVFHNVGLEELVGTLAQAEIEFILLALFIGPALNFISAVKWQLLLRSQGIDLPIGYLFKLYLVGIFFNNFLPTNVGGDVIRSYEVGKRINNQPSGLASVFMERLTGFVILVLVAWIGFLVHLSVVNHPVLTAVMLIAVIGLAGIAWLALDARLLRLVEQLLPFAPAQKYIAVFKKFQTALQGYRQQPRALGTAFALSFVFYLGNIFYAFAASQAFHPEILLLDMVFIMPITMVVAMMPFTFNGIGLQEWSYVLLFPLVGVPASVGLSAIILIRAVTLVTAVVGAFFYMQIKAKGGGTLSANAAP